jgi:hypothetical protein
MNAYRLMAVAVATCAVGLSVAACSAGITTTSPATPRSPDTSGTVSSPTASPSPAASTASASAGPADTISVDAPIGSFPVPHGAQVAGNIACGKQLIIQLGSVTPRQAQAFYASALPRAGYIIASNTLSSDPNTGAAQAMAEIIFAGHGYSGLIIALANLGAGPSASPSMPALPSDLTKNTVEITLSPSGTSSTPMCAS